MEIVFEVGGNRLASNEKLEASCAQPFGYASCTDLELSGMFEMSNRSDCGHASYRVSCTGRKIKRE